METPTSGNTWIGLSAEPLPVNEANQWASDPSTGAIVSFNGIARNHSDGRDNVTVLEYEAYEEQVAPRLHAIAENARVQWPEIVKIVMIHRIGKVEIGDSAVVIAVSSPHRGHAFEAARFCIDTLKSTVPIWKREIWESGESWGLEPQHIKEIEELHDEGEVRL
ncbi:MAG: molybdopterin synthase [Acidimicrobiaceae bacterium]|jgi:molybdopterin synthase catalytic subunit|nr:molybdopterin synthase [Acidimicrobiaceae bacterium]|tara:strand:+ start:6455 stop:6946 length:492 start_codon:yes stop_codon:yes gene_type:complete